MPSLHTERTAMIRRIAGIALYCLLGVLVVVFRHPLVQNLKYLIGPIMLLYGGETVVRHIAGGKRLRDRNMFFYGAVQLLLGIVMLAALDNEVGSNDYRSICVIWATWALLREALELEEAFHKILRRQYIVLLNVAESSLNIFFSVTLLLAPNEYHALLHCWLLSLELITKVLFPPLERLFEEKNAKKNLHIEENNS